MGSMGGDSSCSDGRSWKLQAALVVLGVIILQLATAPALVRAQLSVGFYKTRCPRGVDAERIVKDSITASFHSDRGVAPGIVRMHFHDTFVKGADASVLINATGSERFAGPNGSLRGFEAIDAAKAAVEARCPGVVSCADILAFAARDLIQLSLGFRIGNLKSGRRDGLESNQADVVLPRGGQTVPDLTAQFVAQGLTEPDMVVLSGAHTIGVSHCQLINGRLYTPGAADPPLDPPLDPAYAAILRAKCPQGTTDTSILIDMDPQTPTVWDNKYYQGLIAHKGLFVSDQTLENTTSTQPLVKSFASGLRWRNVDFPASFNKMADIGAKTGTQGEIRQFCWRFNV